jgi:release factor glutamine methyltransferase
LRLKSEGREVRGEQSQGVRGERGNGVRGSTSVAGRPLTPSDLLTGPSHFSRLTSHPVHSVDDALAGAREALAAAGVPDARREADELYAALVGRATSAAWLERARPVSASLRERLDEAVCRRAAGWPQAYAAGRANFRGHWLTVDRRVLIPRPETEGLVDVVLEWMRGAGAECGARPVVADVGTGSGAIAVALALESRAGRVVATDRSSGALQVARANVVSHGIASRVELVRGHLLAPLGPGRFDVVVSNPPYVATSDWERLEPSVRDFEPRKALDGGPNGLDVIRELVPAAWAALGAGGLLALEVDAPRADDVAALVAAAGFATPAVLEDLCGRPRYVRARRPADGSD